ncbi:MAG: hypothetical protein EXS09_14545 [Gemmataceae bacterium]|nr:hypothetical protein [Gemmataceae bacterium]
MIPNSPNGEANQATLTNSRNPASFTADSLRHMRNQTPEESLGLSSEGSLLKPFLLATAIAAIMLVAFTAMPYFLAKQADPTPKQVQAAPEAPEAAPAASVPADPSKSPAATTATSTPGKTPSPKSKDILDVLGESGTKKANPKVNPLDKKDDDILKEIK